MSGLLTLRRTWGWAWQQGWQTAWPVQSVASLYWGPPRLHKLTRGIIINFVNLVLTSLSWLTTESNTIVKPWNQQSNNRMYKICSHENPVFRRSSDLDDFEIIDEDELDLWWDNFSRNHQEPTPVKADCFMSRCDVNYTNNMYEPEIISTRVPCDITYNWILLILYILKAKI